MSVFKSSVTQIGLYRQTLINQGENHILNMTVNFQDGFQNAIDILKYCTDLYAESDQANAFLAKTYFDQEDFKSGRKYLKKALDITPENKFAQRMIIEKQKGEL